MRITTLLIASSIPAILLCFWHRNDVPLPGEPHPLLDRDPAQSATAGRAFDATWNAVNYRVEPQYDYDLVGLVVSFRHHDGQSRMHRRAGDHLNMLDVCVVWGSNSRHPDINALKFWNGIFTCNVSTRDRTAWEAFDMRQLSNNHLVSDRQSVRDGVTRLAIGDQIRVRGWLASYTGPGGTRGTSTTRSDTGDGACETIYVREFEILAPGRSPWRTGLYASLLLLAAGVAGHFRRPYRPYARA